MKKIKIRLILLLVWLGVLIWEPTSAQAQSFVFTAGGDWGKKTETTGTLTAIANSGSIFTLALGDMSYQDAGTEPTDGVMPSPWCPYIKSVLGNTYPFEIVVGNHEDDSHVDGFIDNFAVCLPDRMNSTGRYDAEYYFNYPQTNPLLRVIMIGAGNSVAGVSYSYNKGNARYNWLVNAIDSARASGIRWVAVGMHKNCLTMGNKPCEIGGDLLNLLVEKKVDLVLQGHDHDYQRSKQINHSSSCTSVATTGYNAGCVADDGSDGLYTKGNGPVFVIIGNTGGGGFTSINCSDPERFYFAESMGGDGNIWNGNSCNLGGVGRGAMKFSVSADKIDAQFLMGFQTRSGTPFTDSFSIVSPGGPTPTLGPSLTPTPTPRLTATPTPTPSGTQPDLVVTNFSWNPASPVNGSLVTFSVTIKNQGGGATPQGIIHGVGFYIDGSITANTWSDTYTNSIPAGGSVTLTTNGPPWLATTGSHTVIANVDDVKRISESNEANNTMTKTLTVGAITATPTPTPATCPGVPSELGTVELSATLDQGTYKLWSRKQSQGSAANSYYLQVDVNCPVVVGDSNDIPVNTWTWVDYKEGVPSNKITYPLAQGTHTIKLIGREIGTRVDRILITADLNCIPIGTGDNCSITPSPTSTITTTPTPMPLPGDIDKDGDVDIFDYNLLVSNFGSTSCGNVADIDGNCKVDIFDYNILVENFGL